MTFPSVVEVILVLLKQLVCVACSGTIVARISENPQERKSKCSTRSTFTPKFAFIVSTVVLISLFTFHYGLRPVSDRFANPVIRFPILRSVCHLKSIWNFQYLAKLRNKLWVIYLTLIQNQWNRIGMEIRYEILFTQIIRFIKKCHIKTFIYNANVC